MCFGAFAFEFARRVFSEALQQRYDHWRVKRLGQEFKNRMSEFNIKYVNILPLLHRSIAGGMFIQSHRYYCGDDEGNYFELVGNRIADKLFQYKNELPIWIE